MPVPQGRRLAAVAGVAAAAGVLLLAALAWRALASPPHYDAVEWEGIPVAGRKGVVWVRAAADLPGRQVAARVAGRVLAAKVSHDGVRCEVAGNRVTIALPANPEIFGHSIHLEGRGDDFHFHGELEVRRDADPPVIAGLLCEDGNGGARAPGQP